MSAKTVVFVQGGEAGEAKYPWLFFHLHPHTEPAPQPVDLAFFDYPAGKLKIWKNHLLKRGAAPSQAPDSETELLPKVKIRLFDGNIDSGPARPSVIALYDWVKQQPKGSILSLQVFSHGYEGGPVIWNSYEYDSSGNEMDLLDGRDRDPHDVDFRIRDFVGSNPLAGAEGRKFADAFASDAFIKLWGCVARGGVRRSIRRHMRAPRGSRGDVIRRAALQSYIDAVEESFPMEMAVRLNRTVWAAPLGYGSEPGSKVPTNRGELAVKYTGLFPPDLKKHRWWRVSWFFRNQDRGAEFYRDVLKAPIDAVDFVAHQKTWLDDAKKAVSAAAQPGPVMTPAALQQTLDDVIDAIFGQRT